jgi:hypothetical protein
MTKVRDIVQSAFRKIGVTALDAPMSAAEGSVGVDAFNIMVSAWKLQGVDIGHTDLTVNDDFPLADEFREGTIYLLAERLSPDFMVPASFDADAWFRTFQAAYAQDNEVSMNLALRTMPSQRVRRSVTSA